MGGAEASLLVLLEAFRRRKLEHTVFTMGRFGRRPDSDAVSIPLLNRLPHKAKLAGFPMLDRMLGSYLAPLLEQHDIELLHVQDTYSLGGGVGGARRSDVPTVLTCQNNVGTPFEMFGVRFPVATWLELRERQVIAAIKKCCLIVAVSHFIADQLLAVGVPAERIETLPIPGMMTEFSAPATHSTEGPLRLVALGRLQYQKGFQDFLLALGPLNGEGRKFEAKIAGRGPYLAALQRIVKEHNLNDKVQFVGQVPQEAVPSLIDWSNVVVFPTITPEPFGRAGAEAMSRGKPVIGTSVGAIPELITDGETGYLVRPHDVEAIAEKLRLFADKPALTTQMGNAALAKSRVRFDADKIVDRLCGVYEKAMEMGHGA